MSNRNRLLPQFAAALLACRLIASLLPAQTAAQDGSDKPPTTGNGLPAMPMTAPPENRNIDMKGDKQGAIGLTRREAINIGLGTLLSSAVAATGTRAADGTQAADATGQERLAISFWIWALWDTGPNRIVNALRSARGGGG
jgi:hypothetical protein